MWFLKTGGGQVADLPAVSHAVLSGLAAGWPLLLVHSGPRAGFAVWGRGEFMEDRTAAAAVLPEVSALDVARLEQVGLVGVGRSFQHSGGWSGALVSLTEAGVDLAAGKLPAGWFLAFVSEAADCSAFVRAVVEVPKLGGVIYAARWENGAAVDTTRVTAGEYWPQGLVVWPDGRPMIWPAWSIGLGVGRAVGFVGPKKRAGGECGEKPPG